MGICAHHPDTTSSRSPAGYVPEQTFIATETERLRMRKALLDIRDLCPNYRESDLQYAIYEIADAALNGI
jgi:hypothetical protein